MCRAMKDSVRKRRWHISWWQRLFFDAGHTHVRRDTKSVDIYVVDGWEKDYIFTKEINGVIMGKIEACGRYRRLYELLN